jgi:hypothetical protein
MDLGMLSMPPGVLSQDQATQMMGASNNLARDRALSSGAIAAGAGLLSAPNLREGLAQGLTGFNRGYNTELLANRPKVTPLANGAFSQISFPDGRVEIVGNNEVQQFLTEQEKQKNVNLLDRKASEADLVDQRDQTRANIKKVSEASPMLRSSTELLGMYDKALTIVDEQAKAGNASVLGVNTGISNAALQGAVPGLAGFFGGDQVAANKFLQQLKVAETLANTALTKGAISNAEMSLFMSPIPSLTDDREKVWKPWLAERRPVIEKIKQYYEQQVSGAPNQPSGQAQAPTMSAPSQGASKSSLPVFNSPAEVQAAIASGALESGSGFQTPDGRQFTAQ